MAQAFVGYSGRDGKEVEAIVSRLQKELGSDSIWYAPQQRLSVREDFRSQLSLAILSSRLFLNFESPFVVKLTFEDFEFDQALETSEDYLLYEKELARRNEIEIVNVLIGGASQPSERFSAYRSVVFFRDAFHHKSEEPFYQLLKIVRSALGGELSDEGI